MKQMNILDNSEVKNIRSCAESIREDIIRFIERHPEFKDDDILMEIKSDAESINDFWLATD